MWVTVRRVGHKIHQRSDPVARVLWSLLRALASQIALLSVTLIFGVGVVARRKLRCEGVC